MCNLSLVTKQVCLSAFGGSVLCFMMLESYVGDLFISEFCFPIIFGEPIE